MTMQRFTSTDTATLRALADILLAGGVALLPTDTIYGLHAVAANDDAVARIAAMKGRPGEKPFIVIAASPDALKQLGCDVPEVLHEIWPAPMTAILRQGNATLAARVPALDWLRELLSLTGPLVSTSANRSGEPPVVTPGSLARDLQKQLDSVLDLGAREGKPSAIVDFTRDVPLITREGDEGFTQFLRKTLRKSL